MTCDRRGSSPAHRVTGAYSGKLSRPISSPLDLGRLRSSLIRHVCIDNTHLCAPPADAIIAATAQTSTRLALVKDSSRLLPATLQFCGIDRTIERMVCLGHDEATWEAQASKYHLTNVREMRELNNTTLTAGFRVVRKFCSPKEATFCTLCVVR